jgi:membrane protein DedA with SNARE-associated domain
MKKKSIIQEIMPFLQTYGLLIIFLGVLLEGEFRIIIAGILCQQGTLALGETIAVAIVSAFLSDQIWFQLGRHYGQSLLNRFPFLVKHQHKIQPWVKTKSDTIAFAGRFIYGTHQCPPINQVLGTNRATRVLRKLARDFPVMMAF